MKRRQFLKLAGALSLAGCASTSAPSKARVVVVGGGFGGATAAKYIRLWDPSIDVVLVEREAQFTSCPISNLVLAGYSGMGEISRGYDGLQRHGVKVVRDEVTAIDAARKSVRLASGGEMAYERLIVSPGVDFMFGDVQGYEAAMADGSVLHAWKAGPQTVALRKQLESMPNGGVYALSIPEAPYRCPPGPYERACQVAAYFKAHKPRSKVLVLDANSDVTAEGPLFKRAWADLYPGIVEYQPNSRVLGVDATAMTARTAQGRIRGDVLNIIPPQRAGDIAAKAGLVATNQRWCEVDWRTMESKRVPGIHVLGDATLAAPDMPKSGQMANSQAKACAAAVLALLHDREPAPSFTLMDAGYSFVSDQEAMHAPSLHRYDARGRTMVAENGVVSPPSEADARNGWAWARSIWADTFS